MRDKNLEMKEGRHIGEKKGCMKMEEREIQLFLIPLRIFKLRCLSLGSLKATKPEVKTEMLTFQG